MSDVMPTSELPSRRSFLRTGTLAAVALPAAVGAITACNPDLAARQPTVTDDHAPGHDAAPAAAGPKTARERADEMDRHHEAGIKLFPAETEGKGGQPLEFTMDGDVKVFDLTCDVVQ